MSVELGQWCLALAWLMALLQLSAGVAAVRQGWRDGRHPQVQVWTITLQSAARTQAVLMALAMICLLAALAADDFSVRYVAGHSQRALPLTYKLAAAWGGHEGSLLLWCLMLAVWGAWTAQRELPTAPLLPVAHTAVQGAVSLTFLSLLLWTSNPLARAPFALPDGRDLNPLLQDPALVLHPPLLYAGYVGMVVPFTAAVALLWLGPARVAPAAWAASLRRPLALAWAALGGGILLGSWWAYTELGWGGWWFWDPVENASLMPWLAAGALLHVLPLTAREGRAATSAVLLALLCFALSVLGTFLVRSGVLTSIHAFATDPVRGVALLGLLTLLMAPALGLLAWRWPELARTPAERPLLARRHLLFLAGLLLAVVCATVALGTLYPLAADVLTGTRLSVGAPYFETVLRPLLLGMLVLMGLAPLCRWHRPPEASARRPLRVAALAALLVFGLGVWVSASGGWLRGLGLAAGTWLLTLGAYAMVGALASRSSHPARWWSMQVAHAGVGLFTVAVTLLGGWGTQADAELTAGESLLLEPYRFELVAVAPKDGPNYISQQAEVRVWRGDTPIVTLTPERRRYGRANQTTTESAIAHRWWGDLYVALGDSPQADRWVLRAWLKPAINQLWGGGLLMMLGGLLAVWRPRRVAQPQGLRQAPLTPRPGVAAP